MPVDKLTTQLYGMQPPILLSLSQLKRDKQKTKYTTENFKENGK